MTISAIAISKPVFVFTLFVALLLIVPFLSKRLRIPSIFMLIISGLIIGPNGTGLLANNDTIKIFADTGILYLMFLAGLEIDLNSFLKNKYKSFLHGSLTFVLCISLGFLVTRVLLNLSFLSALLVASMFATQTLISYPIASRLNITRRESVILTIGGTLITDTSVLILLTIISGAHNGVLNFAFWLKLFFSVGGFMFVVLWVFPKIARWFFNTIQSDSVSQYIFVLLVLFVSSTLADLAGIEPIVGAFLSGLALNRVLPHRSPLMNRTMFIGNAIFIPFFLISVGMLIDLKVIFSGFETALLALLFVGVGLSVKYGIALFIQNIFGYTKADRHVIFGLSASQAAATIAIALIGYEMGLVSTIILNSTILVVLITCTVSSFVTERAGRVIAIEENDPATELEQGPDRIIVPVANPTSFEKLFDIALLTRQPDSDTIIYPLFIVNDDEDAHLTVINNKKVIEQLHQHAAATETRLTPVTRVDINIPTGISRTVKELTANKIVMGWSGRSGTINYFFGNIIDNLLDSTQQMVCVVKLNETVNSIRKILVLVPLNADREIGFLGWVNAIISLSKNTGGKIVFLSNSKTLSILKNRLKEFKFFNDHSFEPFEYYPNLSVLPVEFTSNDLMVVIAARMATLSYNRRQMILPKLISKYPDDFKFIMIYPEQVAIPESTVSEVSIDSFDRI